MKTIFMSAQYLAPDAHGSSMMRAMRLVTTLCLSLSMAALGEDQTIDVTLGGPLTAYRGDVWPVDRAGKPLSLHAVDVVEVVTVKLPSGRTFRADTLHSASFSLEPTRGTVRNVMLRFSRAPGDWEDTVKRVDELTTALGITTEQRTKWVERLRAKPAKGSERVFPNFQVEGCVLVATTISPDRAVTKWSVGVGPRPFTTGELPCVYRQMMGRSGRRMNSAARSSFAR